MLAFGMVFEVTGWTRLTLESALQTVTQFITTIHAWTYCLSTCIKGESKYVLTRIRLYLHTYSSSLHTYSSSLQTVTIALRLVKSPLLSYRLCMLLSFFVCLSCWLSIRRRCCPSGWCNVISCQFSFGVCHKIFTDFRSRVSALIILDSNTSEICLLVFEHTALLQNNFS